MDPRITAVIYLIAGLLLILSGFKIQKLVLTITWFFIGYNLAHKIGANFIGADNILLLVSVVAGFILASIGFSLEKAAIAITVAYITYKVVGPYLTGMDKNVLLITRVGLSLIVGILSLLFVRPILIITTTILGSELITVGAKTLITMSNPVPIIIFIVALLIGLSVQFKQS